VAVTLIPVPFWVTLPRSVSLPADSWSAFKFTEYGPAPTPVVIVASGLPDFQLYYASQDGGVVALVGRALDVGASEFLFRGFLMWTLIRVAGPLGVVLATFPFVFTHLSKPELETLSTFFGGLGFGWLAWRTRSVLYGALLHAYIINLVVFAARG